MNTKSKALALALAATFALVVPPAFAEKTAWEQYLIEIAKPTAGFRYGLSLQHSVRKMSQYSWKRDESHARGSLSAFFIISASFSSDKTQVLEHNVTFAWNYQDSYIITTVPLTKVRIRLMPGDVAPTVAFSVRANPLEHTYYGPSKDEDAFNQDTQGYFDNFLNFVIIKVSEKDWPTDITLPELPKGEQFNERR